MLKNTEYFRISLVNTCNLSCYFCHNEGAPSTGEKLTVDELELACKLAKEQGFRKFKLTGGEPTIRPDIIEIVERLAALELEDFSMITNGTLLERLAQPLKDAGLHRLNVSLHTLNEEKYARLNVKQKVSLQRIIRGIDKALAVGFTDMKINFVYTGEACVEDLEDILQFVSTRNLTLVVLPIIESSSDHSVKLQMLYEYFKNKEPVVENIIVDNEGIRKSVLTLASGAKVLLRIDELSELRPYVFCEQCPLKKQCREGIFPLRLSARGELIPCLASLENRIPIKELLTHHEVDQVQEAFSKVKRWREVH